MSTYVEFYMVWKEGGNAPTYKHHSYQDAKHEAARLARLDPGREFHVLKSQCSCQVNDLIWNEPLPF